MTDEIEAAYRALAVSVVEQAMIDLRDRNAVVALDSMIWFACGDAETWLTELDVRLNGLDFLRSGRWQRLNRRAFMRRGGSTK